MESSSRFGKEAKEGIKLAGVKWGIFPSIQAAWVMSNEKWFNVEGINYLKISAGYEESGNDNVDYYAARTYFASPARQYSEPRHPVGNQPPLQRRSPG